MGFDLKKLKSAKLYEKPDSIAKHLRAIMEKRAKEMSGAFHAHTVLCEREDGPSILAKASAFELKEAEVKAIPDLGAPGVEKLKSLAAARSRKWVDGLELRSVPYWASDERPDGHGDIVRQNWLMDEFEKNSPMPYSHEWHNLPIGNILAWRTLNRTEGDYTGPALWLLGLFATAEESQRADEVFRLASAGVLRGGSVGFYSTKLIDIEDPQERLKLGLGPWGLILDNNHLLEFSPTTLGANAGALTILSQAKQKGLLKASDFTVIRELTRQQLMKAHPADLKEQWDEKDGTFRAFAKMLFEKNEFQAHEDPGVPFESAEEMRLRSVPIPSQKSATVEEQLAELREKVNGIEAAQKESALSTQQYLSDIRSLLEKAASAAPATEEAAGGGARGKEEEKDSSDGFGSSAKRILAALPPIEN